MIVFTVDLGSRDVERVFNCDDHRPGASWPCCLSRPPHDLCSPLPTHLGFCHSFTALSAMRPAILVLLACCTRVLGTHAFPLRSHGPLVQRNTLEGKRELPGLLGSWGGPADDQPTDGETEEEPTDLRPTGTTTHGDGASFSSFGLFPVILSAGSDSETAKSKDAASSTTLRSASASATPESRLATTTQAEPAALMTGSLATASSQPTQDKPDRLPSSNSGASSSDSWKIIGVAVICFTAVVVVLVVAVFFDTWWRFVRDLFRRRRAADEHEEMVPDWHKASWEVRFGDRQRYPSFGSLPASPVLRGDPLQRQRSLRVQEWQKEDMAAVPAGSGMTPAERLAQYPAVPPSAYVSPDPRPSPGGVDPFKDKSPSLSPGIQELHKDPFHDAQTSPYDGIDDK